MGIAETLEIATVAAFAAAGGASAGVRVAAAAAAAVVLGLFFFFALAAAEAAAGRRCALADGHDRAGVERFRAEAETGDLVFFIAGAPSPAQSGTTGAPYSHAAVVVRARDVPVEVADPLGEEVVAGDADGAGGDADGGPSGEGVRQSRGPAGQSPASGAPHGIFLLEAVSATPPLAPRPGAAGRRDCTRALASLAGARPPDFTPPTPRRCPPGTPTMGAVCVPFGARAAAYSGSLYWARGRAAAAWRARGDAAALAAAAVDLAAAAAPTLNRRGGYPSGLSLGAAYAAPGLAPLAVPHCFSYALDLVVASGHARPDASGAGPADPASGPADPTFGPAAPRDPLVDDATAACSWGALGYERPLRLVV